MRNALHATLPMRSTHGRITSDSTYLFTRCRSRNLMATFSFDERSMNKCTLPKLPEERYPCGLNRG